MPEHIEAGPPVAEPPPPETPVILAASLGHDVESDPPAAMTAAERWTCTGCGSAVLRCRGNVYGSAVTDPCPAREDAPDEH